MFQQHPRLLALLVLFSVGCAPAADRGDAVQTDVVNKPEGERFPPAQSGDTARTDNARTGFINHTYRDSKGSQSKYVVFIPHAYTRETASPAILFLHGMGQSGNDGLAQAGRGLGEAIRHREQTFPFITIFPQSHNKTWLADSEDGRRALAILGEVQRQYSVDPRRTYLTGYSMGGEGTWSLAAAHPGRFAAIVPLCPESDAALAPKLKNLPCWCFMGDADDLAGLNRTRRMLLAIQNAGGRPMYHEYPGIGHNCWDLTYANPDLYEWLLSQALP
jgi:predicted peptidase